MNRNAVWNFLLLGSLLILFNACSSSYQTGVVRNPSRARTTQGGTTTKGIGLRHDLVQYAKKYVGVPYKYAGKTPRGFDCSGFTGYVFKKFSIQLSASSKGQAKMGAKIAVTRVKPGDLLFFGKGNNLSHVAMVTKNNKDGIEVIHSTSSKGVMVQNVSKSSYWKPRIRFARRVIK